MIAIDSLHKSFGGTEVLRGISATIRDGEMVAITGPSGSGKTSLINILGCLDRPTSGSYRFSGRDIAAMSSYERALVRRKDIGFIFQNFCLVNNLTAAENVELPMTYAMVPKKERHTRRQSLLHEVNLSDRANYPVQVLSGGEQQRVAIARALANRPKVILADEPTGSLDSTSGSSVLKLLSDIRESHGLTLVLVTHDAGVAASMDRSIEMRDGMLA